MSAAQLLLEQAMNAKYADVQERADMGYLHISDMSGCVRAINYRRNGELQEPVSPAQRITMARGNAIEREVREAIGAQLESDGGCTVFHATSAHGELAGYLTLTSDGELTAEL